MKKKSEKLKIGIFNFTCCEGCTVVFMDSFYTQLDNWLNNLEFVVFRAFKKDDSYKHLDIALIEGAISTKEEIKKLKEIRKKSKILIALGSGAVTGWPSNQRNNFSSKIKKQISPLIKKLKQIKEIQPINKFVKVDYSINGCPIDEKALISKLNEIIRNHQNA